MALVVFAERDSFVLIAIALPAINPCFIGLQSLINEYTDENDRFGSSPKANARRVTRWHPLPSHGKEDKDQGSNPLTDHSFRCSGERFIRALVISPVSSFVQQPKVPLCDGQEISEVV